LEDIMKKVLIISPHPDDAELAMGGVIAKMTDAGWEVTIVDLTDGEPTPFGSKKTRKQETSRANEILGIKKRICLGMTNRYLQATLENRKRVAEVIRLNRPGMLFGPILPDYHPDHVAAVSIIKGARFEAKFHKTDMAGEPYWVPKQYGYYSTHRAGYQKPAFLVDVSDCWDRKINAIRAYQSQIKNISSASKVSLIEKVDVVCRYFGQCAGVEYAEPFMSYEPVSIKKLALLADFS